MGFWGERGWRWKCVDVLYEITEIKLIELIVSFLSFLFLNETLASFSLHFTRSNKKKIKYRQRKWDFKCWIANKVLFHTRFQWVSIQLKQTISIYAHQRIVFNKNLCCPIRKCHLHNIFPRTKIVATILRCRGFLITVNDYVDV